MQFDPKEIDNIYQYEYLKSIKKGWSSNQAKARAKIMVRNFKIKEYSHYYYRKCTQCGRIFWCNEGKSCNRCGGQAEYISRFIPTSIEQVPLTYYPDYTQALIEKELLHRFFAAVRTQQHRTTQQFTILRLLLQRLTPIQISRRCNINLSAVCQHIRKLKNLWQQVHRHYYT